MDTKDNAVYERMAQVYDLIYNDEIDTVFYLAEAKNARGPVLEIACGTGRILLRLLQEGIDADGIDSSGAMLSELRKKAKTLGFLPHIHKADMRRFSLGRRYKLIIVPYRSFLHLKDDDERMMALRSFFDHLQDGGRLILHIYNPSPEDLERSISPTLLESEDLVSDDGRHYHLDWFMGYDRKTSQAHYRISLSFLDQPENNAQFEMDLYFLRMKDMERLFERCGFRNIKAYDGFGYERADENSREVVWVAER